MSKWEFTRGLHDIGNGVYAYLQPDGSWGWSNAGLVVDCGQSLLVDTLFDLPMTHEMLDTLRTATPGAESIDILVNTHANGDHCYGNQLAEGAEIIASIACAEEMAQMPPQMLAQVAQSAADMGEMGNYFAQCFASFNFDGISLPRVSRTFDGSLDLFVGYKEVHLIQVGPAHTLGDVIVYVPQDRALFAGDILFIGSTPIMWVGPVGNWIQACDLILSMDVDVIVPGHGPITDKRGVEDVKGYFLYIHDEAKKRYEAGFSPSEAAMDIPLGEYASWGNPERIAINVLTLYQEFDINRPASNIFESFGLMARIAQR
ncbi:MAG: MBL fold metallo-hydrolase [Chloroflexota bacterium]|nr:MBL fold metallo-hydrolase [Chloroflexota bacterium]